MRPLNHLCAGPSSPPCAGCRTPRTGRPLATTGRRERGKVAATRLLWRKRNQRWHASRTSCSWCASSHYIMMHMMISGNRGSGGAATRGAIVIVLFASCSWCVSVRSSFSWCANRKNATIPCCRPNSRLEMVLWDQEFRSGNMAADPRWAALLLPGNRVKVWKYCQTVSNVM